MAQSYPRGSQVVDNLSKHLSRHFSSIYPSSFTNGRFRSKFDLLNVVKYQRGSRGAVSSAAGSWQNTGGGPGGTVSEKSFFFFLY